MAVKKMGFEGMIYYGVKGSKAGTQITNTRDISITVDTEKAPTAVRGAGSTPPIATSRVTGITWSAEWNMLEKSDDSTLEALKVAAAAGTTVALRMKDHSTGKGYDGDVVLSMRAGKPLNGEQTYDFTAEPNDDDRAPQLYVAD